MIRILINNPVGKGRVASFIANLIKYFDGSSQRVKINANKDTITVTLFFFFLFIRCFFGRLV